MLQVGVLRRGKYFKGKRVGKGNAVNEVTLRSTQLYSILVKMPMVVFDGDADCILGVF